MIELTALERNFINDFQGNFPLESRPFAIAAKQLGCTEHELLDTAIKLRAKKILTRFGPLYDALRLGGGLTLAALSVPEKRYKLITKLINSYPEVAHNYRREHKLNMWFVLATEKPEQISPTLYSIEQETGLSVYNFPKQEEFYIGLWLHLYEDNKLATVPIPVQVRKRAALLSARFSIDEMDKKLIRQTQAGLPIVQTPYEDIAKTLCLPETEVLQRFNRMLQSGIIRRIGAVPNHYKLGLSANGMTVWDISDDHLLKIGELVGQLDFVSHCYQRPRNLPFWPYNFFAMVHGHSRNEVDIKAKRIQDLVGNNCHAHDILFSTAILKKTGLRLAA